VINWTKTLTTQRTYCFWDIPQYHINPLILNQCIPKSW